MRPLQRSLRRRLEFSRRSAGPSFGLMRGGVTRDDPGGFALAPSGVRPQPANAPPPHHCPVFQGFLFLLPRPPEKKGGESPLRNPLPKYDLEIYTPCHVAPLKGRRGQLRNPGGGHPGRPRPAPSCLRGQGQGGTLFPSRGGGGIVPLSSAPSDAARGYKSKSCGLSVRS